MGPVREQSNDVFSTTITATVTFIFNRRKMIFKVSSGAASNSEAEDIILYGRTFEVNTEARESK